MTVLPALAAAALGPDARLVARRRGQVLHLAVAPLTPTGRLRRGARPLCGRRAASWPSSPVDGRRLCATCTTVAARQADLTDPRLPGRVPAEQLEQTIRTAPDRRTVEALVLVVARAPRCALNARLLAEARDRVIADARRRAEAAEWARLTAGAA